jgi:transposase
MWTTENRKRYDRSRLRYPSDLSDDEWALVVPLIPAAKPGGNKRTVDLREVMKRGDVHLEHRMPMASDPERPAAA